MWYTPLAAAPEYINFFEPILFMASDSSSGSAGVSHISLRPQKNTTEREWEKKNKRTIWVYVSSKRKKGSFVTPCILCASVDYRGHVFFAKLLQKGTNNADIFSCWLTRPLCSSSGFSSRLSHFCWLRHSLDSPLKADRSPLPSVVDCLSASSFANWSSVGSFANCPSRFSRTCLSSPTSGLIEDLELRPLFGFRAKTVKEIVCLVHTPHSVTPLLMASKQLSEFEKGQWHTMIVDCHFGILQRNWIAIIHQLMFASKILRKLEIIKKKFVAAREKKNHCIWR